MLTVKSIREALEGLPDDLEICCRAGTNDIGTIWNPSTIERGEYPFFGKPVPCLIIEHSPPQSWSGTVSGRNHGPKRTPGERIWTACEEDYEPEETAAQQYPQKHEHNTRTHHMVAAAHTYRLVATSRRTTQSLALRPSARLRHAPRGQRAKRKAARRAHPHGF